MFDLNMKAADIMLPRVFKVKPDTGISEVVSLMLENEVIGVAVVDEEDRFLGVVTVDELIVKRATPEHFIPLVRSRDVLELMNEFREERKRAEASTAGGIMNPRFPVVDEDTTVAKVAGVFLNTRAPFLPVVREGKIVGIIRKFDILKTLSNNFREIDTHLCF